MKSPSNLGIMLRSWRIPLAVVMVAVFLLPLFWLIVTALKLPSDVAAWPPRFLPGAQAPENSLWFRASGINFARLFMDRDNFSAILNSIFIALVTTVFTLLAGGMAGYTLSRYPSRYAFWMGAFILSSRLLPPMAIAVPVSWLYSRLGLLDTQLGLIFIHTCLNLSLITWLMKGFFDDIPKTFEESALIDGYTRWQAVRKVVLPLMRPGIAAASMLAFMGSWNEYAFALTLSRMDAVTLPVRIHALGADSGMVPWGPVSAAALICVALPVVFVFVARKHLLRGVTLGTVKE